VNVFPNFREIAEAMDNGQAGDADTAVVKECTHKKRILRARPNAETAR
jgi:hypothetical protein